MLAAIAAHSAHAATTPASVSSRSTVASSASQAGPINAAAGKADEAKAAALLAGINSAAQQLSYEGTFVFQRGSTVQSSRLLHFVDGKEAFQQIDSLDGKPRSVIQHDDDLFTFLPDSHTVILDRRRKSQDNFPALLSAGSARVLQAYRAVIAGHDRVAGIDCHIVALEPRDTYRFAYRLFIDAASGLLVRAQTLDSEGHVLEQVAFSQLQIGDVSRDEKKAVHDRLRQLKDWKQMRSPAASVDMEAAGWTLDPGVAGFQKVLELRRPMAARDAGAPPVPVDQAVFSDGVSAVSLFIEPVDKSDRKPGEGHSGATNLLAEQHGTFWVTLIGEVPADTLKKIAASIHYQPGH